MVHGIREVGESQRSDVAVVPDGVHPVIGTPGSRARALPLFLDFKSADKLDDRGCVRSPLRPADEHAMFGDKSRWKLKVRVWIERDDKKLLGPGRVELLGHIEHRGSISAAAKQMHMSYRRAWTLVRDINDVAGEPLVEVSTGGPGGGGAVLTPLGKVVVTVYRRILQRVDRAAAEAAPRLVRK